MSMGQWGNFSLDVQNTGASDAWNSAIRDFLPHIATGGMCDLTPEILSAQVFAQTASPRSRARARSPGAPTTL